MGSPPLGSETAQRPGRYAVSTSRHVEAGARAAKPDCKVDLPRTQPGTPAVSSPSLVPSAVKRIQRDQLGSCNCPAPPGGPTEVIVAKP